MPASKPKAPLRVGGVPEHMNLPLRGAIKSGSIARAARVRATWRNEPAGTGALANALDTNHLDLATMLTEGAVAAIARGARFRIVSWWLASPLVWGIHAGARNAPVKLGDLRHPRFAISRFGSGSHLMAFVLAAQHGFELGDFVVVHGLDGARRALASGEADLFLWERAMTSPLVEAGEFARIGNLPTEWPSFVFAAGDVALAERESDIFQLITTAQREANRFATQRGAATAISEQLRLPLDEAAAWLATARWATTTEIDADELVPVREALVRVGALGEGTHQTPLVHRIHGR